MSETKLTDDDDAPLCPVCGAYSTRSCEMLEEAGCCPWEMRAEDETPGLAALSEKGRE